ncbi:DUF3604 domain-containing protein [Zhongshania sp. CAU 1632]|uniref:DUF3604 domain-containing protein n=2 Tax=Zhongshania aquimaris TaxID=2857107 RepID=A0ABS6VPX0_9GAMM|nr:DUF3604 domain-containing protein [Zhongshania aquimaris]
MFGWMASEAAAQHANKLLWGDTHLHSSYSVDAYMAGNRSADPDVAYRYAKGEPVIHPYNRTRVQIQQPLDFLSVADHAEYLGVVPLIFSGNVDTSEMSLLARLKSWIIVKFLAYKIKDPTVGTKYYTSLLPVPEIKSGDTRDPVQAAVDAGTDGGLEKLGLVSNETAVRLMASQWQKSMQAADRHYQPGRFTTLVGWEWSQTASGANLHRVIVSDTDGRTASTFDPVGSDDAPYPEQLWDKLEEIASSTGANFVSIPHNANLSKGYMFAKRKLNGDAFDAEYARKRAKWEPIVEVTQIKGDSETHPDLSPADEFADFERFNFYLQAVPQAKDYQIQKGDTARSALQSGIELELVLGVNPFKFGMIGSTDSHSGIASAEEPNFWGKVSTDSIPENKRKYKPGDKDIYANGIDSFNGWSMSAGGLAAVWARDNTREEIIAAMKRRETYATTGPRIAVRLFAGWDFNEVDLISTDFTGIGYAKGVPMGGELTAVEGDRSPSFMVIAFKGALDHNLDRIQMVKSWVNQDGKAQEKVFNIAWSQDRQIDDKGNLLPVGNTVNIRTGKTANTIGAARLATVWRDPEFDPNAEAVYYVRVLQIPTIRHSQLDAVALGVETPYEGPAVIQERAYTSPIWYSPRML